VLVVIVSISPVPKPVPVSYFHVLDGTPVPPPPEKSSLQVREKPDGAAGTPAWAGVPRTAVQINGTAVTIAARTA